MAEPDYRFTLANERTYLAWLRTALALLGGAVAVSQLIDRSELAWLRIGLGVALVLLGLVVSVMSVWRWHAAETAIRAGGPLPRLRLPWLVSAGVIVIALLVLALVLSGTHP